jgi:hypothetical protein
MIFTEVRATRCLISGRLKFARGRADIGGLALDEEQRVQELMSIAIHASTCDCPKSSAVASARLHPAHGTARRALGQG